MENVEEIEDIDIDDIGTILKSSRLKSKKSLEEISSELCIRKIYLTALEESDYETLPPIPYGVGYIRTYARYLGLSPERAVKLYKAAAAIEEENAKEEEIISEPEANKSNKWHIIIGISVLAVVYGIWNLYVSKTAPKENIIATETIEVVDETEAVKTEENNEEIAEEKDTKEEKKENEKLEKTSEVTVKATETAKEKTAKNTIVLSFSGECWVKLQDKNKVYIERVYRKGDVKELPYTQNLFLSVGVPDNVKVSINGETKDILATKKKMNIPLDSLN